mmetsp:Transcript_5125/g.13552  ORF Transcript_5125/g.13552 Transcript_5125/m.13552 type:complete len:208 (-) Transcript_5125:143-766(-)
MQGTLYDLAHALYSDAAGEGKEAKLLRYLHDVAKGCAYLHARSPAVLHRDLKPPNVLYNEQHECKLCDFGTALLLAPFDEPPTEEIGTAMYMAPEVDGAKPYGLPADIFSFGVMAYECYYVLEYGTDFYADMDAVFNGMEVLGPVRSEPQEMPERPSSCADDGVWDLVCACLDVQPDKRPEAKQIARDVGKARSADAARGDPLAKTI